MLDHELIVKLFEAKKQKLITSISATDKGIIIIRFSPSMLGEKIVQLSEHIKQNYAECNSDYKLPVGELFVGPKGWQFDPYEQHAETSFRCARDLISYLKRTLKGYDPALVSMLRSALPRMVAFDILGVQPMQQPAGLIFSIKSKYGNADKGLVNPDRKRKIWRRNGNK